MLTSALLTLDCMAGYRPSGNGTTMGWKCVPINPVLKYIEQSQAAVHQPEYYNSTLLSFFLNNPEIAVVILTTFIMGVVMVLFFRKRNKAS